MNNYHIYAEIGRGKGSVVYKGREKKTINYVAIKSVEKQYKNKVLNEVGTGHNQTTPAVQCIHGWDDQIDTRHTRRMRRCSYRPSFLFCLCLFLFV